MKKILTLTLALTASLVAFAQTPASTNVPTKENPCVDAEGRATCQIAAPTATDVQVDICNKKYPLTKDEKGVWTGTTDPLVVGFHYYALLVDGVRVNDPNSETFYGCSHRTSHCWDRSRGRRPRGAHSSGSPPPADPSYRSRHHFHPS